MSNIPARPLFMRGWNFTKERRQTFDPRRNNGPHKFNKPVEPKVAPVPKINWIPVTPWLLDNPCMWHKPKDENYIHEPIMCTECGKYSHENPYGW